jgi:hypothetical protein
MNPGKAKTSSLRLEAVTQETFGRYATNKSTSSAFTAEVQPRLAANDKNRAHHLDGDGRLAAIEQWIAVGFEEEALAVQR